jgi:hypothetical protein
MIIELILVLYSAQDETWKIGDFGLMVEYMTAQNCHGHCDTDC